MEFEHPLKKIATRWTGWWLSSLCHVLAAAALLGCGSADIRREAAFDDDRSASALSYGLIRALYEPFARESPGDLVVVLFSPTSTEIVAVRGDEGAAERIYPLGSQAKLVVAMSLLELAQEGVVRLDVPLSELAAGLPEAAGSRTLRDLLTHHGGFVLEPPSWQPPHGGYDTSDLLQDLAENPPGGNGYRYSNLGYMLLAHAVEARIGRSFRDEAGQRLERWMTGREGVLGFEVPPTAGSRALLYDENGEPPEPTDEPYLRWSCCLLEGNALGLASLGQFLLETEPPHHRVLSPLRARAGGWGYVGMGSFYSTDGDLMWNHGAMPGAYSTLALDLSEQRGVAVVSATNRPATRGLLVRALALLRVLRGDVASPLATEVDSDTWSMSHPPARSLWWSLRPEAFSLDTPGVLTHAPRNATLWLRRPLPRRGRIRARVVPLTPDIDVKLDFLAPALGLRSFGEDDISGYRLILGGWENTRSVLASAPTETNVVWEHSAGATGFCPGRPIDIEVRFDERSLAIDVNGERWVLRARTDDDNAAKFIGISGWSSPVAVQELSVERLDEGTRRELVPHPGSRRLEESSR